MTPVPESADEVRDGGRPDAAQVGPVGMVADPTLAGVGRTARWWWRVGAATVLLVLLVPD